MAMKHIPKPFLVLMTLLAATPMVSRADTYFVRTSGDDSAKGTSSTAAFKTLNRAARSLRNGDKIVIGPGIYRENVFFAERFGTAETPISITGDESGALTGATPGPVTIEPLDSNKAALQFFRMSQLRLTGLTLHGPGHGIVLERCRDVAVVRCTFDSLTKGIFVKSSERTRLESDVFKRCAIGQQFESSVDSTVVHNTIAGCDSQGLLLLNCGSGIIRNNIFAANGTNMVADSVSSKTWTSDYNVLTGASGPWGDVPTVRNPYEWFSASGQDRHSVYNAPQFINPDSYDLHIDSQVNWGGGLPGQSVGNAVFAKDALDRDGKPFRARATAVCAGAYDYPDAKPSGDWKKLAVTFKGGLRQSAGIYTASGQLIRTLFNDASGVTELWWDGRDDLGNAAATGAYQVRAVGHDVRLLDDGPIGDNGNAQGVYNPDNADRILALSDGGFIATAVYDEAGIVWRRYAASGQPVFGAALDEGGFWGLADAHDGYVFAGRGKGGEAVLTRFKLPGLRAVMASGSDLYAITTAEEKAAEPKGLAVVGDTAYVSLAGLNVLRSIDLKTGRKKADWPLPGAGDLAVGDGKTLWAVSGNEVVALDDTGKITRRFNPGLGEVTYIAVKSGRVVAIDRKAARVAVLDGQGKVLKTLGQDRTAQYWMQVRTDVLRDPRGAAFLSDGRLALAESTRMRLLDVDKPDSCVDLVSNFMESPVVHPTQPEYVYAGLGIYQVDPKSGAWNWVVETPPLADDTWKDKRLRPGPGQAIVLGGRPFILYYNTDGAGRAVILDVSNPLEPQVALDFNNKPPVLNGWSYATISFTKNGDIIAGGNGDDLKRIPFKGLDAAKHPVYEWDKPVIIPTTKSVLDTGMKHVGAISADRATGDVYYLATTNLYNKMVPGWGADGTGVGMSSPDGKQQWFALSSGGNYMSISTVQSGNAAWTFAGKSFGGQCDVFDSDGLRLATGNWGYESGYQIGFVDLRYGVHAYARPDGKPGVYVEDDAIGRFARARLDGAQSCVRTSTPINWQQAASTPVAAPRELQKMGAIPKTAGLAVNGDWQQWQKAGVSPQIIALPSNIGFKRLAADDLLRTFREGTFIAALAHDDANLYVYALATDDSPQFNAVNASDMWKYDGFELWLEEEQFGLGMTKDGKPALFKWRFHNKEGDQWKAGYPLPAENVWAQRYTDLSTNPLGNQLAAVTGVSFEGKAGYTVMAKIPFEEIKLVSGIAGRAPDGLKRTNSLQKTGDIVRVALSQNNISAWGRMQDYMVDWPVGRMFADPTRSFPFELK